jgi:hypothetical protein
MRAPVPILERPTHDAVYRMAAKGVSDKEALSPIRVVK